MGTKRNPGAYDCYANAEPDEPLFVLLGRDRHAPALVRLWALLRHRAGEDEAKVAEALTCADNMEAWLRQLGKDPGADAKHTLPLLFAATRGLLEHPENYDGPCECSTCLSYD